MFLYYLSRKHIDVLAALEENEQPMMPVENRPVRSGLQRARLAGKSASFIASLDCRRNALSFTGFRASSECKNRTFGFGDQSIGIYPA